jgi:hypothetical protein
LSARDACVPFDFFCFLSFFLFRPMNTGSTSVPVHRGTRSAPLDDSASVSHPRPEVRFTQ